MSTHQEEPKTGIAILDKIFYDSETNRFGIISLLLLAVGFAGALAVYTGGLQNTVELVLIVASTMLTLSLILAVAPIKTIIYVSIGSMFLTGLITILNIFVL